MFQWIRRFFGKLIPNDVPAVQERRPAAPMPSVDDMNEVVATLKQVNEELAEMDRKNREWTATMRRATIRRVK